MRVECGTEELMNRNKNEKCLNFKSGGIEKSLMNKLIQGAK